MSRISFQKAEFIRSAADQNGFLRDAVPQILFAGRSNVGKSSVINRLLGRKNFAYVGATPGKTAHVNYFLIDGSLYIVDLPGYGYARVSKEEKKRWAGLMEAFFSDCSAAFRAVLVVDSRHEPTEDDVRMADLLVKMGIPLVIAANKCDKLKKSEYGEARLRIEEKLKPAGTGAVVLFSAADGEGLEALRERIFDGIGE